MARTTRKGTASSTTRRRTTKAISEYETYAEPSFANRMVATLKSPFASLNKLTPRERVFALIAGLLAVVIVIILLFKTLFGGSNMSASDLTAASTGQVALTEQQLKATVKQLKLTAYWAGPVEGDMYSLDTRGANQIYIRYLPGGNGLADTAANYRVVGTYVIKDAFITTKAAGDSVPNSIGFINGDGAAVYYSKDSVNNVYLAYDGKDIQVEVFDPTSGTAVQLASTPGAVKLVG